MESKIFFTSLPKIFLYYNKKFNLPRCYYNQSECVCFKTIPIDLFFDENSPLLYIIKLKKILKNFVKKLKEHCRLSSFTTNDNGYFVDNATLKNCIKDHLTTLGLFQDYVVKETTANSNVKSGLPYIKYLKVTHKYLRFINKQMEIFLNLLNGTSADDELNPEMRYNFYLTSHFHTLCLFEKYVYFIVKFKHF